MAKTLLYISALCALALMAQPAFAEWPSDVRAGFMEGCTGEGAPKDFCQCIMQGLEKTITSDELLAQSSAFDKALEQSTQSCAGKVSGKVAKWPKKMRDHFMRGCVEESGSPEFCACAVEDMQKRVSLGEALSQGKAFEKAATASATACAHLMK